MHYITVEKSKTEVEEHFENLEEKESKSDNDGKILFGCCPSSIIAPSRFLEDNQIKFEQA